MVIDHPYSPSPTEIIPSQPLVFTLNAPDVSVIVPIQLVLNVSTVDDLSGQFEGAKVVDVFDRVIDVILFLMKELLKLLDGMISNIRSIKTMCGVIFDEIGVNEEENQASTDLTTEYLQNSKFLDFQPQPFGPIFI